MASKPNNTSFLPGTAEESRAGDEVFHATEAVTTDTTDDVLTADEDSKKNKWTDKENQALEAGIRKHGMGKWMKILRDPEYSAILSARSNVDLKDKFRNEHDFEKLSIQRADRKEDKKLKEEKRRLAFVTAVAKAAVSIEDSDPNLVEIEKVNESLMGRSITVRGVIDSTTHVIKEIGSVVLKEGDFTIKCVLSTADNLIRLQDAKDVTNLAELSYLAFQGLVSLPSPRIKRSMKNVSQKVVLRVTKIHGIRNTLPRVPVDTDPAAQNETVIENYMEVGEPSRVSTNVPPPANQGTFNTEHVGELSRVSTSVPPPANSGTFHSEHVGEPSMVFPDVPTPANQGILPIQSHIEQVGAPSRVSTNMPPPANQGTFHTEHVGEPSRVSTNVRPPANRRNFHTEDVGESSRVFSHVPPPANQGILRIQSHIEQVVEPSKVSDVLALANHGILRIQSCAELVLREFFSSEKFVGIRTQKLIGGSSGGASFCTLNCEGYPTFLAHSPQFTRQMAICGGTQGIFEIGPVFKEDSITKQLCEYTGLDVEMRIYGHYVEVMDFVERLFFTMFDKLYKEYAGDIKAIQKHHFSEKLKFFQFNMRLPFKVGVQMLENAGTKVNHPLRGLNPAEERKLGKLVLEQHGTEFYILYDCPFAGSTFYTKQSSDVLYCNSFHVFLRGEKILSGGEREIDSNTLYSRAADIKFTGTDLGDWDSVATYIEAFQCSVPQHGGFGVDLDQVMRVLFAIDNADKAGVDGKEDAVKGIEAGGVQDDKDTTQKVRKGARVRDKEKQ